MSVTLNRQIWRLRLVGIIFLQKADDMKLYIKIKYLICNVGEVVGASSFSVGHGANALKKVSSVKMLHQASEVQNILSYPLKRTVS